MRRKGLRTAKRRDQKMELARRAPASAAILHYPPELATASRSGTRIVGIFSTSFRTGKAKVEEEQ